MWRCFLSCWLRWCSGWSPSLSHWWEAWEGWIMSPQAVVYDLEGIKEESQGGGRGEFLLLKNKALWSFSALFCLFLILELLKKDPGWLLGKSPNITESNKWLWEKEPQRWQRMYWSLGKKKTLAIQHFYESMNNEKKMSLPPPQNKQKKIKKQNKTGSSGPKPVSTAR